MSTEPQEVQEEAPDQPEITAEAFPSLGLVYELVPHSISWSLGRYDTGQSRLQGMLIAIPILTFGAIGVIRGSGTTEPDACFYAALGFFAAAMAACIFTRATGKVRFINPDHLLDESSRDHADFQAIVTDMAGEIIRLNADRCTQMGNAVRAASALLSVELLLLLCWWF